MLKHICFIEILDFTQPILGHQIFQEVPLQMVLEWNLKVTTKGNTTHN